MGAKELNSKAPGNTFSGIAMRGGFIDLDRSFLIEKSCVTSLMLHNPHQACLPPVETPRPGSITLAMLFAVLTEYRT